MIKMYRFNFRRNKKLNINYFFFINITEEGNVYAIFSETSPNYYFTLLIKPYYA